MIDFDKMTKAEHEEYREMVRKAEGYDRMLKILEEEYDYSASSYGDLYEDGEKQQLIIKLWSSIEDLEVPE